MTAEEQIELPEFEREIVRSEMMEWWILKGPHGAVQFVWLASLSRAMGVDLGTHRPCEESDTEGGTCQLYGTCRYDGSGMAAEQPYQLMVAHGPEAVWRYLENYYLMQFLPHCIKDSKV